MISVGKWEYHIEEFNGIWRWELVLNKNYGIQTGIFESSFDLSNNSPGIYQVRFISGEKVIHKRIILQ